MSQEEASNILTTAAKTMVDKNSKEKYQNSIKDINQEGTNTQNSIKTSQGITPQELQKAKEYLRNKSKNQKITDIYEEDMSKTQDMFTTTSKKEYEDPNHNPNQAQGLEDNSLVILPISKVGTEVIKDGIQVVTKSSKLGSEVVSKTYTNQGRKADIYIKNHIIPKTNELITKTVTKVKDSYIPKSKEVINTVFNQVKNKSKNIYYETKNKFLQNPTQYTQGGIDTLESYLPGVPVLSYGGLTGWSGEKLLNYELLVDDFKKIKKRLIDTSSSGYTKDYTNED